MAWGLEPMARWSAAVLGPDAVVLEVRSLRAEAGPWRLRIDRGGEVVDAVLRVGGPGSRQRLATEAAALRLAEAHRLAAPRVLAVDLEGAGGQAPVLLTTALAGSSSIPAVPSVARLRGLGAAAAALHQVATPPLADLPLRVLPLADVDFAAQRRATGSSPLLDAAATHVRDAEPAVSETVLVHGDLWQGNTLWVGNTFVGMVDWDAAGAGHPGVDLGTLRCDAAIMHGLPAAAEVSKGWRLASGAEVEGLAYWDLVAGLTSPTDMAQWLPVAHQQGRTDLDARTLARRRDAFLEAALDS